MPEKTSQDKDKCQSEKPIDAGLRSQSGKAHVECWSAWYQ